MTSMRVRVEFTTEPFHGEGELPRHVAAAAAALTEAGLVPDLGPLGTLVEGDSGPVFAALSQGLQAALDEGATRITVQVEPVIDEGAVGGADVRAGDNGAEVESDRQSDVRANDAVADDA